MIKIELLFRTARPVERKGIYKRSSQLEVVHVPKSEPEGILSKIDRKMKGETGMQKSFKEQFPKDHRPEIADLEAFWNEDAYNLFRAFSEQILQKYDLRFGIPLWTETYGWTYRIGKSGVFLVKGIRMEENGFIVDGVMVHDKDTHSRLLAHMEEVYQQKREDFLGRIAEKNARQADG